MKIAVPKEVKNNENRVGLSPDSVNLLTKQGHKLFVESNAGIGIGFNDDDYLKSGAIIIKEKHSLYEEANLIVKVKEPLPEEFSFFNESHTLFTYLHLAADMNNAKNLAKTGVTGIAYETITSDSGAMPLLAPMSNIAGQISILVGSYFLLKPNNGLGVMLGNFEGVDRRIVTVIGAGVAGTEAIKKALINNAHVKVIDLSQERLDSLKKELKSDNVDYILSSKENILEALAVSDLVIGSVYVIGKEAPKVITRDMLSIMKEGSVIVDISIDQGGCIETSQPTTHDNPVFIKDGVVHYCVTNMPGAVPLTATLALNRATLPYISRLAKNIKQTLNDDKHFRAGLSLSDGEIVHPALLSNI
jgi:alanine dehydrogenase